MPPSTAPLTRDDLRLKIAVQRVRLDGVEYRVIRPARPIRNGALYRGRYLYDMFVDRADGRRIGALWLLAARSPRSLVYLPLRETANSAPPGGGWGHERPVDLVLAHRALQFRPTRWKRLRERLNAGNAPREVRTASVPLSDLSGEERELTSPRGWTDAADTLRERLFAETLFLTGPSAALRERAREFFSVTKDGPPHAATRHHIPGACNYHVCEGISYWSETDRTPWDFIHLEYCPSWRRK